MKEFAEKTYFEEISTRMKQHDLHVFASVVTDAGDCPYHIPASNARDTRLFYWLEQRSVIIQLTYTENDYFQKGDIRGYWKISLYFQGKAYCEILDETDTALWDTIPFYGRESSGLRVPTGFSPYGGRCEQGDDAILLLHLGTEQKTESNIPLSPEMLVHAVCQWIDEIRGMAGKLPFNELQVTDFPPHYVFPGSEKGFWEKFDKRNLRSLVKRAWGSEGLER